MLIGILTPISAQIILIIIVVTSCTILGYYRIIFCTILLYFSIILGILFRNDIFLFYHIAMIEAIIIISLFITSIQVHGKI